MSVIQTVQLDQCIRIDLRDIRALAGILVCGTRQWQCSDEHPLRIAVNLSARQFKDENLSQMVLSALQDSGMPAGLLELELTEGTLMDDARATLQTLERLRAIGVYLSIDDFGTGYSSMNYLKRFNVSALKIDRSFITGLPQDSENAAITRAIIAMAHGLKLSVVAEGVETNEQLRMLEQYGCDMVQGYYLGHPSPPENITLMLAKRPVLDGSVQLRDDTPDAPADTQAAS